MCFIRCSNQHCFEQLFAIRVRFCLSFAVLIVLVSSDGNYMSFCQYSVVRESSAHMSFFPGTSGRVAYSWLTRTMSRRLLNISKDGESITSQDEMLQYFITLSDVKTERSDSLCFDRISCVFVCACHLLSCHWAHWKNLSPSLFHSLFGYLYTLMRSSLIPSCAFSRLNSHSVISFRQLKHPG